MAPYQMLALSLFIVELKFQCGFIKGFLVLKLFWQTFQVSSESCYFKVFFFVHDSSVYGRFFLRCQNIPS